MRRFFIFTIFLLCIPMITVSESHQWVKVGTLEDWKYSYFITSAPNSTVTGAFAFLDDGKLVHIEQRGSDAYLVTYSVETDSVKKLFSVKIPNATSVGGEALLLDGHAMLALEVFCGGNVFIFPKDDMPYRIVFNGVAFFDQLIEAPYKLAFFHFPFIFWEFENEGVSQYYSGEVLNDRTIKYRDPEETKDYLRKNKGSFGSLRVDENGFILDGDRLLTSNRYTFADYFRRRGGGDASIGPFIGFDADGNYYSGSASGIGVEDKNGNNIRLIEIPDPNEALQTECLFSVRVDPCGVLYTIRFDEPTKTVELWKLDPGVISEERRAEIRATGKSELYDTLRALAEKKPVSLASKPGVLNDSGVRLRSSPTLDGAQLAMLDKGVKVEVLARSKEKQAISGMKAYWYKVNLGDGKVGWIYGAFVDVTAPDSLPVDNWRSRQ
jgi:hypothetical protein